MRVVTSKGNVLGYVMLMKNSCFTCSVGISVLVRDSKMREVCELTKGCCVNACCTGGQIEFKILINGSETGCVAGKDDKTIDEEVFAAFDTFKIEVPRKLRGSRYKKVLLVAATMLL